MESNQESGFGWAKLQGLPKTMRWPVKLSGASGIVFCKSDDIEYATDDIEPFPGNLTMWKEKGQNSLKRRKNLLNCFNQDLNWAVEMCMSSKEEEETGPLLPQSPNWPEPVDLMSASEILQSFVDDQETSETLDLTVFDTFNTSIENIIETLRDEPGSGSNVNEVKEDGGSRITSKEEHVTDSTESKKGGSQITNKEKHVSDSAEPDSEEKDEYYDQSKEESGFSETNEKKRKETCGSQIISKEKRVSDSAESDSEEENDEDYEPSKEESASSESDVEEEKKKGGSQIISQEEHVSDSAESDSEEDYEPSKEESGSSESDVEEKKKKGGSQKISQEEHVSDITESDSEEEKDEDCELSKEESGSSESHVEEEKKKGGSPIISQEEHVSDITESDSEEEKDEDCEPRKEESGSSESDVEEEKKKGGSQIISQEEHVSDSAESDSEEVKDEDNDPSKEASRSSEANEEKRKEKGKSKISSKEEHVSDSPGSMSEEEEKDGDYEPSKNGYGSSESDVEEENKEGGSQIISREKHVSDSAESKEKGGSQITNKEEHVSDSAESDSEDKRRKEKKEKKRKRAKVGYYDLTKESGSSESHVEEENNEGGSQIISREKHVSDSAESDSEDKRRKEKEKKKKKRKRRPKDDYYDLTKESGSSESHVEEENKEGGSQIISREKHVSDSAESDSEDKRRKEKEKKKKKRKRRTEDDYYDLTKESGYSESDVEEETKGVIQITNEEEHVSDSVESDLEEKDKDYDPSKEESEASETDVEEENKEGGSQIISREKHVSDSAESKEKGGSRITNKGEDVNDSAESKEKGGSRITNKEEHVSDSVESDSVEKDKEYDPSKEESEAECGDLEEEKGHGEEVSECDILRDVNVPEIYIRKVLSTKTAKSGKRKKSGRTQNVRHACFYCGKLLNHIPPHMKAKHSEEKEVKEILELRNSTSKSKKKMKVDTGESSQPKSEKIVKGDSASLLNDILRARGDHKHNSEVRKQQKGEMIIFRRPKQNFDHTLYGPCGGCNDWMLLSSIPKHQKTCPQTKKDGSKPLKKKASMLKSRISMDNIPEGTSKLMLKEVFPIMQMDKEGKIAQDDELIVNLGEFWLRRNIGNETKRKYYSSQHMRDAAKLLIKAREIEKKEDSSVDAESLSMWQLIRPAYIDTIAQSALNMSFPDAEDEEILTSPSNAIKIKYDLVRITSRKMVTAVKHKDKARKEGDENGEKLWTDAFEEAQNFKVTMEHDWDERVTRLARKVILNRRLTKVQKLPNPEDLSKLSEYTKEQLKELDLSEEAASWTQYREVIKYAQARLLVYNRRRSGELEAIQLKSYLERSVSIDDVDKAIMGDMTATEKYLLKSQELMKTRGKRDRQVPVLIPPEIKPALDYLADTNIRQKAGISAKNKYLFPNQDDSVIRSYSSLGKVCAEAQLETPECITSVSMRKYMSTLAQVMDLNDSQLDWVCRHMGHTKEVHLQHYRTMSGFIERVQIGKLLLMQDLNIQSKFSGKKLEDIDFKEIISMKEKLEEDIKEDVSQGNDQSGKVKMKRKQTTSNPQESNEEIPQKKRKKNTGRKKWSEKEEQELRKYMSEYLDKCITPGKACVEKAMAKSRKNGGELYKRHYHNIVSKISNHNKKVRKNKGK